MDKNNWIIKHKGWSIIISLLIIFSMFVFLFLLEKSDQTNLTGKVIDEELQEQTQSSPQSEEEIETTNNQQTNDKQTQEQSNQEEESCEYKYLDEYRCNGESVEKKRQNFDCSTDWIYGWKCYYGCEDGGCIDKPVQDQEETEICEVGYLEEYKCNDKWRQRKWQYLLCSTEWKNFEYCSYGCNNSKCNSKPEEKKCDYGYIDEYNCDGNTIERKWINSDCSFQWFYFKSCDHGCSDGECNSEPQEQSEYYKVTYVVDGDTLDIDTGERIRLICIDTPERGEYYYSEAKEYLKSLTLNKEVDLVKDISETDRYGRLLRYIYLTDGTFVNELMVRGGYARAYPYNPDTTLCPQIENAEEIAKENHLGIWAEEEEETLPNDSGYICSYNAYNCGDFSTHAQAQTVFEYCGGISNDIHRLDGDYDGLACESLP